MPVESCMLDDKPGYRWGKGGACYAYMPNDEKSMNEAKRKAHVQGYAIQVRSGKVQKDAPGVAPWVTQLSDVVSKSIGMPVLGLFDVDIDGMGLVKVSGLAQSPAGISITFEARGAFDLTAPLAVPTAMPDLEDPTLVYPFGTALQAQEPEATLGTADDVTKWNQANVPVIVQPTLPGYPAILEKNGGKAALWFSGTPGTDQLSKFPALKEYVLKDPSDFVAQANVYLEKDGAPMPQDAQATLLEQNPTIPEGAQLAISLSDLVYGNEDLHNMDAAGRYEQLEKIYKDNLSTLPEFRQTPTRTAADRGQLDAALEWARAFPGSTGAVVKLATSPYMLVGKNPALAQVGKADPMSVGIYKVAPEQRMVYGVILRPNVLDAQEDIMTPEDVVKAAHYYLENSRVLKLRHGKDPVQKDDPVEGAVLESYIAPCDFKLGAEDVKAGDWVVGVRVDDQGVWQKILDGEYRAFSPGGEGARQELQ